MSWATLNEMQMQFVETIRSNVIRMEHLVTDISDISKLKSGRMRLDRENGYVQKYRHAGRKSER